MGGNRQIMQGIRKNWQKYELWHTSSWYLVSVMGYVERRSRLYVELWCWSQESWLRFPSWSSSDSTFCRLCWCPGLLGVSASRLLCFFPTGGGHSAVVLISHLSSFLHRASAFCHGSKQNLPPNQALLFLKLFCQKLLYPSYSSKCQITLQTFSPFLTQLC